jgi:hypothetical protein
MPKRDCHVEIARDYRPIGVVRRRMKHNFRHVGGFVEGLKIPDAKNKLPQRDGEELPLYRRCEAADEANFP